MAIVWSQRREPGAGFVTDDERWRRCRPAGPASGPARTARVAGTDRVRFGVGESTLGSVLVAATDKGVCAISLGDDPERLIRDLHDRFPHATPAGRDEAVERMVATVIALVEAPSVGVDLPLDVRGTAFQERVWQALREIPAGTTVTYAGLAARLGTPRAIRAVGRACATNPIAVAIPCHRVLGSAGALAGYRWGLARKRALLERETAP